MFGFKKKTAETSPATTEKKPGALVKFGSAALAAIFIGGGLGAASTHVDKIPGTPVAASSDSDTPAPTDLAPITPDTTTFVIPSNEAPTIPNASEVATPTPAEVPASEAATEAPIATELPTSATSEVAPVLATVEVPALSVAKYESQPQELIRAFVETDLQAWANASANAETVQVINARLAQGEDLTAICNDIAHTNASTFAPALFGENYATVPSITASVETFTEINAKTLESYFKTAGDDTKYLAIITGIGSKVYDEDKAKHSVQGAVSISIANNGPDTSLGADAAPLPVEKYNILLQDSQNTGNYTVTGFSQ